MWQNPHVTCISILRRGLAILLIVGLITAPLAASAVAATVKADSMSGMMAGMADDMPCCPHQSPSTDDRTCPFMAICMAQMLVGLPAAMEIGVRTASAGRTAFSMSDTFGDGLAYSPPPRPPRSLIFSA